MAPGLQVASLQHMVVYFRDCCDMTPKQGTLYEAPDSDEQYPLQNPEFELGQEAPPDKQDHYLVCI